MRARWSRAIAGIVLIIVGGLLGHLTQTSGGIRIEDVRFKGAKGNTMSALRLHPARTQRRRHAGARHPRRPRLHQFPRDPGRLRHRIRPARLCGGGAGPDRPRLQRPAGLRQRVWRPGWPRLLCAAFPIVDKANIGLEGHSMGGWTMLAAASRNAQRLQGDGAGGLVHRQAVRRRRHAEPGRATPRWCSPNTRNSPTLMWGVRPRPRRDRKARSCGRCSAPRGPVEPGKVYGDIAQGTAPRALHAGDDPSGRTHLP